VGAGKTTRRLADVRKSLWAMLTGNQGAQIVEFAIALPLLMVFLIGITDFGGAFNLKQKLTSAAREGARFGANTPTADLSSGVTPPASVDAVGTLVSKYLQAAQVNACGIVGGTVTQTGPVAWTYTATCPTGTLTMVIDRGYPLQVTSGGTTYWVINTQVSLSYPYKWQFNRVIPLLVPGANYAGASQISTSATVPNLN
jgi:Flp pilus assembly protein TadG